MKTIDGSGSVGDDRAVLVALYEAAGGGASFWFSERWDWEDSTNWLSAAPLDEWYGVTTDRKGRVLTLYLHSNELIGSIPAELGQLQNLTYLILGGNYLAGTIPAELAQLEELTELHLDRNELTGSIPAALGQLKNLTYLNTRGTELRGTIPIRR